MGRPRLTSFNISDETTDIKPYSEELVLHTHAAHTTHAAHIRCATGSFW